MENQPNVGHVFWVSVGGIYGFWIGGIPTGYWITRCWCQAQSFQRLAIGAFQSEHRAVIK